MTMMVTSRVISTISSAITREWSLMMRMIKGRMGVIMISEMVMKAILLWAVMKTRVIKRAEMGKVI